MSAKGSSEASDGNRQAAATPGARRYAVGHVRSGSIQDRVVLNAAVFKKSRTAADLQRPGRDVAKDPRDIASLASLTKSFARSDRSAAMSLAQGRTSAESLLTVPGTFSHQSIADHRALRGSSVGVAGGASTADRGEPLNANLTENAGAVRTTAPAARLTNLSSGRLWQCSQPIGPAIDGVVTHPGGSHEKCSYAGI